MCIPISSSSGGSAGYAKVPLNRKLAAPQPQIDVSTSDAQHLSERDLLQGQGRVSTPRRSLVMLVDDDQLLLAAVRCVLEAYGFDVLSYNDPMEALLVLRDRDDVSMLLTDLQMPLLSGVELATICTRLRPTLPVVIQSGAEPSRSEKTIIQTNCWAFHAKPVAPGELVAAIYKSLSRGSTLPS